MSGIEQNLIRAWKKIFRGLPAKYEKKGVAKIRIQPFPPENKGFKVFKSGL